MESVQSSRFAKNFADMFYHIFVYVETFSIDVSENNYPGFGCKCSIISLWMSSTNIQT